MLAIGARAPEFNLPNHEGRDTSLTSLLSQGSLIVFFYPGNLEAVCTKEACLIRDLHGEIVKVGLNVCGISPQSSDSHSRFRERLKLPFALLSDTDKSVIKMYQVNGPMGFGVRRATYLVDRGRIVRGAVLADLRIADHEAFVRRAIVLSETGR